MKLFLSPLTLLAAVLFVFFKQDATAKNHASITTHPDIAIALGGNAWVNKKDPKATEEIKTNGLSNWTNPSSVVSIYFKVEEAGELKLALRMKVGSGTSVIKVSYQQQAITKSISNTVFDTIAIGTFKVKKGYVKIDVQGLKKTGADFGSISHLIVKGSELGQDIHYVKDNEQSRFYWGRRGPSVHLSYVVPEAIKNDVEWFYSEITVPKGMDPVGSYFQANGFGQGYFGIQVNSATERRVLFSLEPVCN